MSLEEELNMRPYQFPIPDYNAFEEKSGKSLKLLVRPFQYDAILPKYLVEKAQIRVEEINDDMFFIEYW